MTFENVFQFNCVFYLRRLNITRQQIIANCWKKPRESKCSSESHPRWHDVRIPTTGAEDFARWVSSYFKINRFFLNLKKNQLVLVYVCLPIYFKKSLNSCKFILYGNYGIFHWWIVSTFRVHSCDHTCNWGTASSALLSTGHSLSFHGFFDM